MLPTLAELIAPHTVAEFFEDFFGVRPLAAHGAARRFARWACDPARLARRLEYELEAPVSVVDRPGDADTIVLQTRGQSRWTVDRAGEASEAALADGSFLYIPRGWRQDSDAGGERLLLAVVNPTGLDLLDWLVEQLRRDAAFQRDIPRFAGPAAEADWHHDLTRTLGATFGRVGLIERFRRDRNDAAPPHPPAGVAWRAGLGRDHVIEIAARRPWRLRRASEGAVYLVSNGKPIVFEDSAAALLHFLAERAPAPISAFFDAFSGEFDAVELEEFLAAMAAHGLISFHPAGAEL